MYLVGSFATVITFEQDFDILLASLDEFLFKFMARFGTPKCFLGLPRACFPFGVLLF